VSQRTPQEEEADKLRARIRELEAELKSKDKIASGSGACDSWSDAERSTRESANRTARGLALASIESVRSLGDAVSSFADGVISPNDARENQSARDLVAHLPGDVARSFADTVTNLAEIPASTAGRYSSAYREGEKAE